MQFVANEMAAIIQNIATQTTPVTQRDLKNAMQLAFLSIFPGTTMHSVKSRYFMPLGYIAHSWIYYVVGTGENEAATKWQYNMWSGNAPNGNGHLIAGDVLYGSHYHSYINYTSGAASSIWPTLKISKGEAKLLVEVALYYGQDSSRYFSDGTCTINVPPRKAFNFLLFSPKIYGNALKVSYFPAVTIFTTQGGFSEVPPQ